MLPTNLQSPAEWARQSHSATNTYSLADEYDVYGLALHFDVYFQSSTTSVHDINIQGMRSMTIRHFNSPRVKHFVATKLFRNAVNFSSIHRDTRHGRGTCVAIEWDTKQKTQTQRTTRSRSFTRHLARRSAYRSSIRCRIVAVLPKRVST